MSKKSIEELILAEVGDMLPAVTPLLPSPPESTTAALDRCRAAWQKAFDEYMRKNIRRQGDSTSRYAAEEGAIAYRGAMPLLAGAENIRDFIACVAYGILIEAIKPDRAGQLLYAAQVAVTSIPRPPKPAKPDTGTPSPSLQKQLPASPKSTISEANSAN
jgi:hypothetical protein